jgi:hypothetical protein
VGGCYCFSDRRMSLCVGWWLAAWYAFRCGVIVVLSTPAAGLAILTASLSLGPRAWAMPASWHMAPLRPIGRASNTNPESKRLLAHLNCNMCFILGSRAILAQGFG